MRGCDRVVDDGRVSVAARVTRVVPHCHRRRDLVIAWRRCVIGKELIIVGGGERRRENDLRHGVRVALPLRLPGRGRHRHRTRFRCAGTRGRGSR